MKKTQRTVIKIHNSKAVSLEMWEVINGIEYKVVNVQKQDVSPNYQVDVYHPDFGGGIFRGDNIWGFFVVFDWFNIEIRKKIHDLFESEEVSDDVIKKFDFLGVLIVEPV